MADDKGNAGAQDRARINLSEDYEVWYWTETLRVSEDRLREAVTQVGSSADKVRIYLGVA